MEYLWILAKPEMHLHTLISKRYAVLLLSRHAYSILTDESRT